MADNNKFNWSDFIGGIGSVASSGLNFLNQQMLNRQQMKFNREERIAAQEYNTSERLAVQDYNSPVNQMNRLLEAGINPNTAADMLSSTPSSAQSVSGASMNPQMTDIANPLNDMAQFAQVRLIKEQAEAQAIQNQHLDRLLGLQGDQTEQAIKVAKADVNLKKATESFTNGQTKQLYDLLPIAIREGEQRVRQMEELCNYYIEQTRLAVLQQTKTEKETGLISAQTGKTQQETANLKEDQKRLIWENGCRELGVDPHSDFATNMLTMLLKHPDTAKTAVTNFFEAVKGGFSAAYEKADSTFGNSTPWSQAKGATRFPWSNYLTSPTFRQAFPPALLPWFLQALGNQEQ